jgi:hypothetical protein
MSTTANDLVAAVRDGSREAIGAWLVERSKQWDTIRPYTVAVFEAAAVDPELRGLVDRWIEEVAGDLEEGLGDAGRFDPATKHMRGVPAFAQLDHVARNWAQGRARPRDRRPGRQLVAAALGRRLTALRFALNGALSGEGAPAPAVASYEGRGLRRAPRRRLIERDRSVVGAPVLEDGVHDPP